MKTTNQTQTLRQSHFLKTCREIARQSSSRGIKLSPRQIVSAALQSPAPSYYVDYSYALRKLSHLSRLNTTQHPGTPARNRMWNELRQRLTQTLTRKPHLTPGQALAEILAQGHASSFFISLPYALRLYYRHTTSIH